MDIKQVRETADRLFGKRHQFMSLCQELAENFYPQRADFTSTHSIGEEFAGNLMTSYPVLTRRDLADQIGSMLRPTNKPWFHMKPSDEDRETNDAKRWLEQAEKAQRRVMYDKRAMFTRCTKEGDHDFAAFGNAVESVRLNRNADGLIYRCWHVRDVVWMENDEGENEFIARRWKPYARDLANLFPGKVDPKVNDKARKEPYFEMDVLHIIISADQYEGDAQGKPYWSIYYDCTHDKPIEMVPVWNKEYNISRWQTVSGSQYAYSPASIVALPDARLIQSMTYTLLEAGEKAVNPPVIVTQDAIRSDMGLYAGGHTWVDNEYDERLGAAMRPLTQDTSALPFGIDMQRDSRMMISEAFFLNKLNLPERGPEMTAYEVGQRVQEYIRGAMPLFEPMESERNGGLCELTFDQLFKMGVFGSPYDMPESLQGADIQFHFESPLHDAIDAQKGQKFLEAKQLLAEAIALDQSAAAMIDMKVSLRDALDGIGIPTEWINPEDMVEEIIEQQQQQMQQQQMLDAMEQGSNVAKNLEGVNIEA